MTIPTDTAPDASSASAVAAQRRSRFLESQATQASITSPEFPDLAGLSTGTTPSARTTSARTAATGSPAGTHPLAIQIDVKKPASSKIADSGKPRAKSHKNVSPLVWVGSIAAGGSLLVIVVIAIAANAWWGKGKVGAFRGKPTLVLEWPEAERRDAVMFLDGKKQAVPKAGAVRIPLETMGKHTLLLQRRGYQQHDYGFSVSMGDEHPYKVAWEKSLSLETPHPGEKSLTKSDETFSEAPLGFAGWMQVLEIARKEAAAKKKDILMVFAGSDWSGPSVKMANEIFSNSKFLDYAQPRFVLVVIDDPKQPVNYNMLANPGQNSALRKQFLIRDRNVPTVVLMDVQGMPFVLDGYFAGNADSYVKRLNELSVKHRERDERLKLAESTRDPAARLQAAEAALDWLRTQGVSRFYGDLIGKWLRLARTVDPKNELGKQESFFEEDWQSRFVAVALQDQSKLPEVLRDVQEWSQEHKFQDHDRAVRMNLLAAKILMNLGENDAAYKGIETALRYSPKDAKIKDELLEAAKLLNSRGRLSSGTGFVVDAAGFILTNYHVIEGPGNIVVRKPDSEETVNAKLVAQDEEHDLALLQIDAAGLDALRPLPLADANVNRGSRVAVFGFPLGDAIGSGLKFNAGQIMGLPEASNKGMLLIDGRINPGNSGGPLLNNLGKVVGMVTAKSYGGEGLDSYGMAIPANELRKFIAKHRRNFTPPDPANDPQSPLEWDEVDARVKDSVLMIIKLQDK